MNVGAKYYLLFEAKMGDSKYRSARSYFMRREQDRREEWASGRTGGGTGKLIPFFTLLGGDSRKLGAESLRPSTER